MGRYVIATTKSWNIRNAERLIEKYPNDQFVLITDKNDLTANFLHDFHPRYIFFPHWSWIIPTEIYENYDCVVFHMTDLPFGRGGSPLQNLLVRGIYGTKISAVKADAGIDTGSVYFKEPLDISEGNADTIFSRASAIVFGRMIPRLMEGEITPHPQEGEAIAFKRRKPEQSEIPDGLSQRQIYDYIRMLDGEGYPAAYKKYGDGKVYYRKARLEGDVVFAEAEFRREQG